MIQMFGKYIQMANKVRLPVLSNLAQCMLKLEKYDQAIEYCTMVLPLSPHVLFIPKNPKKP